MIDELIFKNLTSKFTRELVKGDLIEAESVVKRLEDLGNIHSKDSLGTMIYFTVRGMKRVISGRKGE